MTNLITPDLDAARAAVRECVRCGNPWPECECGKPRTSEEVEEGANRESKSGETPLNLRKVIVGKQANYPVVDGCPAPSSTSLQGEEEEE